MSTKICFTKFASPIGTLQIFGTDEVVTGIFMENHRHQSLEARDAIRDEGALRSAVRQLEEYFAGGRTEFSIPVRARGTEFQQSVWHALRAIPYGVTISYGELARRIGRPRAVRAVGLANGRNPVSIIVPCHRVIGMDGSLTGYGGGLERKRFLIELEKSGAVQALGRLAA